MNNLKIIIYVQSRLHRFCIFVEMYTKYQYGQVSMGLSATARQHHHSMKYTASKW